MLHTYKELAKIRTKKRRQYGLNHIAAWRKNIRTKSSRESALLYHAMHADCKV